MKALFVLIIILFYGTINAQDTDVYFGKYEDKSDSSKFSFIFDTSGVVNLTIMGNAIPDSLVKYDLLGVFGGTLFMKIIFKEAEVGNYIMLLMYNNESDLIVSTGFWIKINLKDLDSNSGEIIDKFTFDLKKEKVVVDYDEN